MDLAVQPPTQGFRFEDLPAELRVLVYRQLLVDEDVHIARHHLDKRVLKQGSQYCLTVDRKLLVAVLRTNRLAYQEALPLFYGTSNFLCSDPGTLKKFVTEIGSGIQHLEYISILDWLSGSGAEVAFKVLAERAIRLKKIVLNLEACSCTRSSLLGGMLNESLRHYLEDVSPEMRHQRLSKLSLHLVPVDSATGPHTSCAKPSPTVMAEKAQEMMIVLKET